MYAETIKVLDRSLPKKSRLRIASTFKVKNIGTVV
jgi:hypothetical protein